LGVLFPFPLGETGSKISSIDVLFYIDGLRGGVWVIFFFLQWFYQPCFKQLIYLAWTWWRWFLGRGSSKDNCPYDQVCCNYPVILFKAFFSALSFLAVSQVLPFSKSHLFSTISRSFFLSLSLLFCLYTKYCVLGLVRPYILFIDSFEIVVLWICYKW